MVHTDRSVCDTCNHFWHKNKVISTGCIARISYLFSTPDVYISFFWVIAKTLCGWSLAFCAYHFWTKNFVLTEFQRSFFFSFLYFKTYIRLKRIIRLNFFFTLVGIKPNPEEIISDFLQFKSWLIKFSNRDKITCYMAPNTKAIKWH